MASLLQGLKNIKANLGTAASEMQHIANQLQGSGTDEKKLLEAVQDGKTQEAAALLTANPNVIFARTVNHWHNAWHIAAKAGSLPMLEVLHLHGRGATRKPLPGEPPPHAARTRDKRETPLMLACANNHLNAMHYLLGVGADARDGDKYGNTIVHYAALKGQVKMLSILLAMDEGQVVDTGFALPENTRLVDMRNEAGLQPLHFAVWGGDPEVVQVLLDHRPDLIAKSTSDSMAQVTCNGGSIPLHVAALRNDPGMVKMLLNAYVKAVNEGTGPRQDPRLVADNYKFTPYSLAMDLRREAVLPLLNAVHQLPGLDLVAAAAAAAGLHMVGDKSSANRRRSFTSRKSTSSAGVGSTDTHDIFDGFAALAAGADKHLKEKMRVIVPALTPPPPPGAKAGKAVAAKLTPTPLPTQPESADQEGDANAGASAEALAHEEPRTSIDSSTACSSHLSASETEHEQAAGQRAAAAAEQPPPSSLPEPSYHQAVQQVECSDGPAAPIKQGAASSAAGLSGTSGSPDGHQTPADAQDIAASSQGVLSEVVKELQTCQDTEPASAELQQVGQDAQEQAQSQAGAGLALTEAAVSLQQAHEQQHQQQGGADGVLALSEDASDTAADCCASSDSPQVSWPASEAAPSEYLPGEVQQADTEYVVLEVRPGAAAGSTQQQQEPVEADAPAEVGSGQPSRDPPDDPVNWIAPLPAASRATSAAVSSRNVKSEAAAAAAAGGSTPPEEFLCPITNMLMTSPVIASDGRAYEADALEMWMSLGNKEFPGGGELITCQAVTPADYLRQRILDWKAANHT